MKTCLNIVRLFEHKSRRAHFTKVLLHRLDGLSVIDSIGFEFISLLLKKSVVMGALVLEVLCEFFDLNLLSLLGGFSFFEELSKLVSLDESISLIFLGVFN